MSTIEEPEVGQLYEYISDHPTILWADNEKIKNRIYVNHFKIRKGDLFVFLENIDKANNSDFLICRILIAESGIIGGIACRKEDIKIKKE